MASIVLLFESGEATLHIVSIDNRYDYYTIDYGKKYYLAVEMGASRDYRCKRGGRVD